MTRVRNTSDHPVDLADGRVLAPDETADVDVDEPHNAAAVRSGNLTSDDEPEGSASTDEPDGSSTRGRSSSQKGPAKRAATENAAPKRARRTSTED